MPLILLINRDHQTRSILRNRRIQPQRLPHRIPNRRARPQAQLNIRPARLLFVARKKPNSNYQRSAPKPKTLSLAPIAYLSLTGESQRHLPIRAAIPKHRRPPIPPRLNTKQKSPAAVSSLGLDLSIGFTPLALPSQLLPRQGLGSCPTDSIRVRRERRPAKPT